MTEAASIASTFLAFALAAGVIFSLLFPAEIGELIGRINKVSVTPKGVELGLIDGSRAIEKLKQAYQQQGASVPSEAQLQATTNAAIGSGRILWVDDKPANNESERAALRYLGYRVDLATSNDEALKLFSVATFDLIVSDIRRDQTKQEDETAGLKLPDVLRQANRKLPPIIYYVMTMIPPTATTGRTTTDRPITNNPSELLRLISNELK